MKKLQGVRLAKGWRWSTGQGSVLCYVFLLSFRLTDVQPPQWQGSAQNCPRSWVRALALPFCIFLTFLLHFCPLAAWASAYWALCFFANFLPPICFQHPWPKYFIYLFYFYFYFIKYIFLIIKNHKNIKMINIIFLFYFIFFSHKKYLFLFKVIYYPLFFKLVN